MDLIAFAQKDSWTNAAIPFLFNRQIIEYDMKRAGLSLIKEYQLLPKETIQKIESYRSKHEQDVIIGRMERTNKELVEAKKDAFAAAREQFYRLNDLEETDILDVRKDAIFVTRNCPHNKFGEYIEFRPKNVYSSFLRVGKRKIELFYRSPDIIDVKGINDEVVKLHKEGMLIFFTTFIRKMETGNTIDAIRYLRYMIDRYKNLELPLDYYREFNQGSSYRSLKNETAEEWWDDRVSELEISNNYQILCRLAKILI